MKFFLLVLIMLSSGFFQSTDVSEVRAFYREAAEKEEAAEMLMESTKDFTEKQPVLFGYKGAAHMLMAKYVGNPFSKMSHFNKGKKIFTAAIEEDGGNIELRFLRYAVQSEAPGFLGYRDNLKEDKALILAQLNDLEDADLHRMISRYMLASESLSEAEKQRIRN